MRVARWLVAVLVIGTAGQVAAQESSPGSFYFFAGGSAGSADVNCDVCGSTDRTTKAMGTLALAARLDSRNFVGAEVGYWNDGEASGASTVYSVMPFIQSYLGRSPIFISGGLGLLAYRADTPFGDVSANALGASSRIGVDLHVSQRVSLAPYFGLLSTLTSPEVRVDGEGTGVDVTGNILQFGIGISVR